MLPHSNIFAWRIPWTKETSRLQSMGSYRIGHDRNDLAIQNVCVCVYVMCMSLCTKRARLLTFDHFK